MRASRPTLQSLTTTSAPAREPITVEQAKRTARVDFDDTDEEIDELIAGAREWLEEMSNRALITQTLRAVYRLPSVPESKLRGLYAQLGEELTFTLVHTPLQSVSSVEIETDLDVYATLTLTSDYVVDASSDPARVFVRVAALSLWYPQASLLNFIGYTMPRVRITYVAGYGDTPDDVPANFKRALRGAVAALYDDPTCTPDNALLAGLDSVRNV